MLNEDSKTEVWNLQNAREYRNKTNTAVLSFKFHVNVYKLIRN